MPEISFSKAKLARKCTQAYHYRYHERLRRKRPGVPLIRGTILHEMITARSDPNSLKKPMEILKGYEEEYRQLFREEKEIYGELIPDIKRIFQGYEREYADDDLRYESHEEFVATDLGRDIRFVGYIDKRCTDPADRHWLMDHKTHRNIPNDDQRFSDLQLVFYVWAYNRERERKLDGVIWDYLRTKPPTIPEVLKNGELSQRKNMDTDYHTYLSEIQRLKLDPANYEETLDRLKNERNTFFKRVFLPSPPKVMIDNVVNDMRTTATLIKHLSKTAITRNMTHLCASTCDYYNLCQSELRGLDSAFVRKTEYEEAEIADHKKTPEEDA